MNIVTITRTKFTNIESGSETFGFRIYDDNGQTYDNCFSEAECALADKELFNLICDRSSDGELSALIDWAMEHGIDIDGESYSAQTLTDWRANS